MTATYQSIGWTVSREIDGESVSGVFDVEISLHDLLLLRKGSNLYKPLGVVGGYPLLFNIRYEENEHVGVYMHVARPHITEDLEKEETRMGFIGCWVCFQLLIRVASVERDEKIFFRAAGMGFADFFFTEGKKWGDVVCEGSPYVTNGVLKVHVSMTKTDVR
jgi:hypothetical protein